MHGATEGMPLERLDAPPLTPPADLAQAVDAAREALHARIWPASVGASLLVAVVLAPAVGRHLPTPAVLGWALLLTLALATRAALGWQHRRALAGGALAGPWLARYRWAYGLHGLAWCAAAVLWPAHLPHEAFDLLLVALTAIVAGSIISTAFDLRAAACFSVPTLAALVLNLWSHAGEGRLALGVMVLLFAAVTLASAQRAQALVRQAVQAREALGDRNRLFADLLASTEQGFWFIDTEGRTTDLNPAMCRLLGRPREAVLGRHVQDFFDGVDLARMQSEIAARRAGQAQGRYEIGIRRPDGSRVWCLNQATAVHDAQGQRQGSVGIWTDISARREAELTLRDYERITNAMPEMVSVVGADRVYRMVNDAWCRLSGRTRDEALGRSAVELLGGVTDPERDAALQTCLRERRPVVVCSDQRFPPAPARRIETIFAPLLDSADGTPCVVLISRDVGEREAARAALETSAQYLRRTLEATGDGIFASDTTDPDAPVRFANDPLLRMWQLTLAPGQPLTARLLLERAATLFTHPDTELAHIRDIVAHNRRDETRLALRDGRTLLRRCEPAALAGGETLRVWSFRDITAEVRALDLAQRAEAEQRQLLDAFPGLIACIRPDGDYTYGNGELAARLGRPVSAIIGHSITEVLGPERAERLQRLMRRVLAGQTLTYEHRHRPLEGSPQRYSQITLTPGRDPASGTPLVIGFGVDITALKRAEEALISARDEAQRANQAKTAFLSQMSHELRTPLNAVLGFGQLLESDREHPLAARQASWVREILRGAQHLLSLINEILDLGRIEAGQMLLDLAPVPLEPLVHELQSLMQPLAQKYAVTLQAPQGDWSGAVLADRTRLKQVLLNLMANAVKYNRAGGQVWLSCAAQGDQWQLTVHDTGLGIAPEDQQRLFQPFERLQAARSGVEGTGIGLALSRRLVEAMQGSLGLHSRPGEGSAFWLSLPRAGAPVLALPAPGAPGAVAAPAAAPQPVLYIEDNPVNVALMEAMLGRLSGVQLSSAATPAEGLRLAQSLRPALILLDIQLPGMDGFEVLAHLKANALTRAIPAVAVSANALPSDIDAAIAAGFVAYITKPLSLDRLLDTVNDVLAGQSPGSAGGDPPAQPSASPG